MNNWVIKISSKKIRPKIGDAVRFLKTISYSDGRIVIKGSVGIVLEHCLFANIDLWKVYIEKEDHNYLVPVEDIRVLNNE